MLLLLTYLFVMVISIADHVDQVFRSNMMHLGGINGLDVKLIWLSVSLWGRFTTINSFSILESWKFPLLKNLTNLCPSTHQAILFFILKIDLTTQP